MSSILLLVMAALCPAPGSAQFVAGSMIKFRKGYFVLTNGTTRGNIGSGGLAGANAFCLSDLNANNWRGKPTGTLSAAKVRAFLCNSTTCQNPMANQYYYFAASGFPTDGGAYFRANATGGGPGDSISWGGTTYFNVSSGFYFWSNRARGTSTNWGMTPASSNTAETCQNWTNSTNSFDSAGGDPGLSAEDRWNDNAPGACNSFMHLICMVDP